MYVTSVRVNECSIGITSIKYEVDVESWVASSCRIDIIIRKSSRGEKKRHLKEVYCWLSDINNTKVKSLTIEPHNVPLSGDPYIFRHRPFNILTTRFTNIKIYNPTLRFIVLTFIVPVFQGRRRKKERKKKSKTALPSIQNDINLKNNQNKPNVVLNLQ